MGRPPEIGRLWKATRGVIGKVFVGKCPLQSAIIFPSIGCYLVKLEVKGVSSTRCRA